MFNSENSDDEHIPLVGSNNQRYPVSRNNNNNNNNNDDDDIFYGEELDSVAPGTQISPQPISTSSVYPRLESSDEEISDEENESDARNRLRKKKKKTKKKRLSSNSKVQNNNTDNNIDNNHDYNNLIHQQDDWIMIDEEGYDEDDEENNDNNTNKDGDNNPKQKKKKKKKRRRRRHRYYRDADGNKHKRKHKTKKRKQNKKKSDFWSNFMWSHQKTTSRSIKERLMTHEDPLRLILRYKKIPGKLLLHVLLVCFVTAQLILYAQKQPFLAHNSKAFSEQFLPDGYKNIEESSTGYVTYVFHDVSDITRDFDRTIAKFYGFVNESPDVFSYMTQNTTAENHFMRASVSLRTQSTRDVLQGDTKPKDYNAKLIDWPTVYISCNDTWDSIIRDQYASNNRDFFDRLHHLQFVMELRSIDDPDADHPNCVHWTIYKNYYQQGTGSTISTLEYDYDSNCPGYPDRGMARRPITWVCTVGMLVSLVQIILHLRSFVNRHRLYKIIAKKRNILSQYTGRRKRADAKSRAETIKQYSASVITGWMVFTVFVASFNLVVGFVLIFSQPYGRAADTSFYLNLFLAADGFLVWMNCLRYFQFSPKLYILILTLKNGMPKVIQFVTGALPVFFGYAFAGTILFGHYAHYFDSFSASCITLFAIMNGDAMHDIFDMIYGFNPFLAQLSRFYLYTFVVLFICCVLNIFILIMEDAFFFVKRYISEHKDTFDMTLMSDHAVGQHLDRITQSDSDSSSSSSSSSTSSSDSSLSSSDEEQGDQTQDRGGGNKDQAEISPSDETPSRSIPRSHSAAQAIMSRGGSGSLGRPKLSFRSRKGLARASTLRRVNTSDMLDTETEGFSSSFYLSGADDGYEDYGGDEDYDDDDKEDDEEDEEEEEKGAGTWEETVQDVATFVNTITAELKDKGRFGHEQKEVLEWLQEEIAKHLQD